MKKVSLNLFKETADELNKKLEDPYFPGSKIKDLYPDEVGELLEMLFWVKNSSDVSIRVTKADDVNLLNVEILNRK
jgi:hypothetical protein